MSAFGTRKFFATTLLGAMIALAGAVPSFAFDDTPEIQQSTSEKRNDSKFLGVDLDNGSVYYNGRNSGRYCLYRTVQAYNAYTGYVEWRRVRRCGRGLYL